MPFIFQICVPVAWLLCASNRFALAQLLARRGMAVDVYEKREKPTNHLAASLHSYPVRTWTALHSKVIELAAPSSPCCPAFPPDETRKPLSKQFPTNQMMLSQRSRRALEAAGAEPACCAADSPTVQGIVSLASGKVFVRPRASYLVRSFPLPVPLFRTYCVVGASRKVCSLLFVLLCKSLLTCRAYYYMCLCPDASSIRPGYQVPAYCHENNLLVCILACL